MHVKASLSSKISRLWNVSTLLSILKFALSLSVGVRKLQVAILARSSREMYLTVRIVWKYIPKNFQSVGELGWLTRVVYFNDPATGYEWGAPMNASGAGGHGWAPMNSDSLCGGRWWRRRLCECTCVRVCVHVRLCVHAHACARVRVCTRDVFAIYDKIFDPGW